jgi:AAA+ ATPase superfamily predicted ATPase
MKKQKKKNKKKKEQPAIDKKMHLAALPGTLSNLISIINSPESLDDENLELFAAMALQNNLKTPVRAIDAKSNYLSFDIDLKKELNSKFKSCLLFLVRAPDTNKSVKQLLDDMNFTALKEGAAGKPHLIFHSAGSKENLEYVEDEFTNSFINNIEELKNIVSSSQSSKIIVETLKRKGLTMADCPFNYMGPCSSEMFIGREDLIKEILFSDHKAYAIAGGRRIGKTSLLLKLQEESRKKDYYYPVYIDCSNISDFASIEREISKKVYPKFFYTNKERDFDFILERGMQGKRLLLLLDEIDPLIEKSEKFISLQQSMERFFNSIRGTANKSRLKLIITGFYKVYEMIHKSDHPFYNLCARKELGVLNYQETRTLISMPFLKLGIDIKPKNEIISKIYNITRGHPSAVQFIAKRLFENKKDNKITIKGLDNVLKDKELIDFIVDFFVMNTSPLEKYICYICIDKESFNQSEVSNIINKKFADYIEDDKIYYYIEDDEIFKAMRHLIFTNILFFDYEDNIYKFLYPAMQTILTRYFFSESYITTLEKELF